MKLYLGIQLDIYFKTMKTQQEIEKLAEQYLWGKIFLTKKDKYQTEIAYMSGYKQCQQDIDIQLQKAIEYGYQLRNNNKPINSGIDWVKEFNSLNKQD